MQLYKPPKTWRDLRLCPVFCVTNKSLYRSHAEASRALGVRASTVSRVLRGEFKRTGGYVFVKPTPEQLRAAGLRWAPPSAPRELAPK